MDKQSLIVGALGLGLGLGLLGLASLPVAADPPPLPQCELPWDEGTDRPKYEFVLGGDGTETQTALNMLAVRQSVNSDARLCRSENGSLNDDYSVRYHTIIEWYSD